MMDDGLIQVAKDYLAGNLTRREFQNAVAETVEVTKDPAHGVMNLNDFKKMLMGGPALQQRAFKELHECERGHIYLSSVFILGSNSSEGPLCPYCRMRTVRSAAEID